MYVEAAGTTTPFSACSPSLAYTQKKNERNYKLFLGGEGENNHLLLL